MIGFPSFVGADLDFFLEEIEKAPTEPPKYKISEYVEDKRILPPNTPFPGYWECSRTPYTVEIMDNLSPRSPIQQTVVMKGAQLGLTAAAENVIAYWIDEFPAEILFVSATDKLLEKWATKRLEPLIDSCGFRNKIFAQGIHKQSRRTGDKIFSKEFAGGSLDMASAQSAPSLRAESKRILIRDEIDGAPPLLRTGEGNWLEVSYARTNAWGNRKKIFDFSTPTTFTESLISPEYEDGDKRRFFVPCPHCGQFQILQFGHAGTVHGLKGETKAGLLEDVFYICDHCHDPIWNHHKTSMLNAGRWEPTSISFSKVYRSYQISSLYSPVGMLSWFELFEKFLRSEETPDGKRSFVNLYLGEPFKESGSRPKLETVIEKRGNYKAGTVPDGVLFLTAAIDVQAGSKNPERKNPARLEMEICGHGPGFRTSSILYRTFEGEVDDPEAGAWKLLDEFAAKTGMIFRRDDGREFPVELLFIDSGDGNLTDVVYRFTQRAANIYPSKGFSALRKKKKEKETGDERSVFNVKRFRPVHVGTDLILYEISTNFYKTWTYNNLRIDRQIPGPQRPGFCDFPIDYSENYFRMLIAEEKRGDGSFHCPSGRRNEALDCRVMNLCASDVYLDREVLELRAAAKNRGATPAQIAAIDHRFLLSKMIQATARVIVSPRNETKSDPVETVTIHND